MAKMEAITVGVNIDLQELYDNLISYKTSIEAQINSLGNNPSICTHKTTEDFNGVTFCSNSQCRKVINTNGLYDYAK